MNNQQLACEPERIELFLHHHMNAEEQAEFESHLDGCDDCRSQLEQAVASQQVWTTIRESLHSESPSRECENAPAKAIDLAAIGDSPAFSVESVIQLLAPTDDDRMLGRLGTYEVVGIIGAGGMGVVLKAFDPALNRYVAIKILSPHLGNSGAARKRFSREAQAAAAVVHDNVIEIHGVADTNGLPYLVMPYVKGPSLQKRLDEDGPLSVVEILRIAKQAAAGLAEAHAQGLVHRDVKPANILLADGVERVKLTDFGLARAADDASLTKTGVIAGTPQFMSPEQARGDAVDAASDLFGLGSVMYTMCTGRAPFRAETSYGILRRITDTEPRPIREINPDVPEWLCAIITKLMSKAPEHRFESADEVAQLLEDCLAHVQQPTTVTLPKRVEQLAQRPARQPHRASERFSQKPWANANRLVVGAVFAFTMIFAGILIVLELNKGTLRIESDFDDIAVRITQQERVVKRLTVSDDGASIRIAAGQYVLEIEGEHDAVHIVGGRITVTRGGDDVVRIVRRAGAKERASSTGAPGPVTSSAESAFDGTGHEDKITVDIYCGADVLPQMNTRGPNSERHNRLVLDLNAIKGVTTNFREAGPGNEISMVIVRDSSAARTPKAHEVRARLNSALKDAGIQRVRWEYGRVREGEAAPAGQAAGDASSAGTAGPSDEEETSGAAESFSRDVALVMLMHPELGDGDMVQQAAASVALGQLRHKDYCGILRYTKEGPSWLWGGEQGLVRIGERRAALLNAVIDSRTGDTPRFDEGLRKALASLTSVNAIARHMIVLTNGDPSLDDDAILREFRDAGITISVVHLESHGPSYEAVPKRIAKTTGGRYYHVLNVRPSVVDAIFLSETRKLVERRRAFRQSTSN